MAGHEGGDDGLTLRDLTPDDRDPTNSASDPNRYWSSANVGEATPDVLSPMCWSFWGPGLEAAARRAYADMGILPKSHLAVPRNPNELMSAAHFFGRPAMNLDLLRTVFDLIPGMTADDFERDICGKVRPGLEPTPRRIGRSAYIAARAPAAMLTTGRRLRRCAADQRQWWDAQVFGLDSAGAGPALLRDSHARFVSSMRLHIRGRFVLMAMHAQLADLVEGAGLGDLSTRLLAGMGDVAETEVAEDLWRVSHGQLDLDTFVARHGFHGHDEGNLTSRSWREDSRPLESVIDALAKRSDTEQPALREAAATADRQSAIGDLLAALPQARRPVARLLCRLAAAATRTNEIGKAAFLMAIDGGRAATRAIGTDLTRRGVLDDPEDAFYLTAAELRDELPADARDLVAFRRARREAYRALELPVTFTGSPQPIPLTDRETEVGDTISGGAGSAGVVEGPARVVLDPADGDLLAEGEVLVCRATDPSWTPLFLLAKGLVIDIGAAASHGAIVAREMGIPCVIGTGDGTRRIRTGDTLHVDGSAGTVTIIDKMGEMPAGDDDGSTASMSSPRRPDLVSVFDAGSPGSGPTDVELSKERLGGKGFGLATMAAAGLPVPPGFTLPTDACCRYLDEGWTDELTAAVDAGVGALEESSGRRLGDTDAPLLVSVRSGAAVSMPGMMDTVLNVGMTPAVEKALAAGSGDEVFAADTHRRFLTSFAEVVGGLDHETAATLAADPANTSQDVLRAELARCGADVPDDPRVQVLESVQAVFRSWGSPRARAYREREGIDHDLGTAATVQLMVFGNMSDDSGTGVAFTRHPSTGEPGLIGDFLVRAQGEDVVAGTHKTLPLDEMRTSWPGVHAQLVNIAGTLERTYTDMVDIEFTVERGTLWMLQARTAKRSPEAVFRTAVDMANDPDFPVDRPMAVERCRHLLDSPPRLSVRSHTTDGEEDVFATGLAASPGRAAGVLCTDIDDAMERAETGQAVILARRETSPSDVHGIAAAVGLVTSLGGLVSHAAVVARAWGLPAVVGASDLEIDESGIRANGRTVAVGETITVDGTNGRVLLGRHADEGQIHPAVETIRSWAELLDDAGSDEMVDATASAADSIQTDLLERVLVLKGMATTDALADVIGTSPEVPLESLARAGRVESKGAAWTPTESAKRDHGETDAAIAKTHGHQLAGILDRFHDPNVVYKQFVTDWQVRDIDGEQAPNDHNDADYDDRILRRLRAEVHGAVSEVLGDATRIVGRLADYQRRLDRALDRIEAGDQRYMAHPMLDSYHTVWFELHEELIRLSGRNRATEAAAGRA